MTFDPQEAYPTAAEAASAAASAIAACIERRVAEKGRAIGIFDAAPSQADLLRELVRAPIPWIRVIALQTGESLGLDEESPRSSRRFLLDHLVTRVPIAEFHGLRGEASNARAVAVNYAALLASRPPDFAVLSLRPDGRLGFLDASAWDAPASTPVQATADALALMPPAFAACAHLFLLGSARDLPDAASPLAAFLRAHPDARLFLWSAEG